MVGRVLLMCVVWFPVPPLWAATPAELLAAVRDAQRMNATRYPTGSLDADVVEVNLVDRVRTEAHVHQEWAGTASYWKYSISYTNTDDGRPNNRGAIDNELIRTDKLHILFNPTDHTFVVAPLTRLSLPHRTLELRPAKTWHSFLPFLIEANWDESLDKTIMAGSATSDHVKESNGKVTIQPKPDEFPKGLTLFDLAQGGNLIQMKVEPWDNGTNQYDGRQVDCEWIDHGQGVFRLKSVRVRQFKQSPETPFWDITCQVTAFRPQDKISPKRFTPGSIALPKATQIATYGATGAPAVTYVGGAPPKARISDQTLEQLSKELQQQRLSAPKRPTP